VSNLIKEWPQTDDLSSLYEELRVKSARHKDLRKLNTQQTQEAIEENINMKN